MTDPRVLLLTSSFPQSPQDATADFLRHYAKAIDLAGTVLTPEGAGVATSWSLGRMNVEYVPYWLPRSSQHVVHGWGIVENLRRRPWAYAQLPPMIAAWTRAAIRAVPQHDVIVAHWAVPSGLVGLLAAAASRRPLVTVLHSGGVHALHRIPGGRRLAASLRRTSGALVASSSFVRDRFVDLLGAGDLENARASIRVLPMGFAFPGTPVTTERGAPTEPPSVLFLGRINTIKGLDVLIDACALIEGVRLQVAGYGPLLEAARSQSRERGVDAVFHGQVDAATKWSLLDRADVFVLPSRVLANGTTEGLPVALLEAMGRGTPVVATAVGGIPELVHDGVRGIVVPPDDPEALSQAVQSVLGDPRAAATRAQAARTHAREFDWSVLGPAHRDVVVRAALG